MEIQPLDQLTKIINDALNGTAKLHKSFKTFFVTTSILFLSMTKRKNFTQMALFSDCSESLRCMVTGWTSGISTWMRL